MGDEDEQQDSSSGSDNKATSRVNSSPLQRAWGKEAANRGNYEYYWYARVSTQPGAASE